MSLIIADAVVIAAPPIRAPRNEGLSAQPPAIVAIRVVSGTVSPDPDAVPKYPMTMTEAVKVIVPFREPAVLEPIPTVVTLNESITITMLETAAFAAFCEPRSTPPGPSIAMAAAVMPRHCAVMTTAAAVSHSRAASAAAHYFRTTATVTTAVAATVTTAVTTVTTVAH